VATSVSVEWPSLYADLKSLKFCVDMIWGCSHRRASLSMSLDKVLSFVTGLKFNMSDLSSPGFFSNDVTRLHFSEEEKTPSLIDKLAYCAISGAIVSAADFK